MNRVRPCEHETSASSCKLNAVQTMAAVTAPPVAPCACHYNTAIEPLSPRQSGRGQSLVLVSTHLLQPGCPLFGSLRGQSLVPVSTHLLQPGRLRCQSVCQPLQSDLPLLGSLRYQSLTTGSAHLLQCTLPPLRTLCSASSLSRSRRCLNLRSLCSAVSPARRILSRSLLRRSLSSLFCDDPVVSMLVAKP